MNDSMPDRRPMRRTLLLICSILALQAPADLRAAQAPASYSASAIFSGQPDQPFNVAQQPNKLAAMTAAMQACLAAHPPSPASGEYCELRRLDELDITPGQELRAASDTAAPFLWQVTSPQATVFLAGSVHMLKPGLYPLPAQFQQAFNLADHFVVEVNLSAYPPERIQQVTMAHAMLPQGQTLSSLLNDDLYAAMQSTAAEYGLALSTLEAFKPGFVIQQMTVMAMLSLGYMPQMGMEQFFTGQAGDKTILELESLEFQLELLMNQPLQTQLRMAQETLAQMHELEPLMAQLIGSWVAGNDEIFEQAFTAQQGSSEETLAFMRQLIDERNLGMADKINGYLQQPGTYFVLAGAGHFIGDNSIIQLLAKRGVSARRIAADETVPL